MSSTSASANRVSAGAPAIGKKRSAPSKTTIPSVKKSKKEDSSSSSSSNTTTTTTTTTTATTTTTSNTSTSTASTTALKLVNASNEFILPGDVVIVKVEDWIENNCYPSQVQTLVEPAGPNLRWVAAVVIHINTTTNSNSTKATTIDVAVLDPVYPCKSERPKDLSPRCTPEGTEQRQEEEALLRQDISGRQTQIEIGKLSLDAWEIFFPHWWEEPDASIQLLWKDMSTHYFNRANGRKVQKRPKDFLTAVLPPELANIKNKHGSWYVNTASGKTSISAPTGWEAAKMQNYINQKKDSVIKSFGQEGPHVLKNVRVGLNALHPLHLDTNVPEDVRLLAAFQLTHFSDNHLADTGNKTIHEELLCYLEASGREDYKDLRRALQVIAGAAKYNKDAKTLDWMWKEAFVEVEVCACPPGTLVDSQEFATATWERAVVASTTTQELQRRAFTVKFSDGQICKNISCDYIRTPLLSSSSLSSSSSSSPSSVTVAPGGTEEQPKAPHWLSNMSVGQPTDTKSSILLTLDTPREEFTKQGIGPTMRELNYWCQMSITQHKEEMNNDSMSMNGNDIILSSSLEARLELINVSVAEDPALVAASVSNGTKLQPIIPTNMEIENDDDEEDTSTNGEDEKEKTFDEIFQKNNGWKNNITNWVSQFKSHGMLAEIKASSHSSITNIKEPDVPNILEHIISKDVLTQVFESPVNMSLLAIVRVEAELSWHDDKEQGNPLSQIKKNLPQGAGIVATCKWRGTVPPPPKKNKNGSVKKQKFSGDLCDSKNQNGLMNKKKVRQAHIISRGGQPMGKKPPAMTFVGQGKNYVTSRMRNEIFNLASCGPR